MKRIYVYYDAGSGGPASASVSVTDLRLPKEIDRISQAISVGGLLTISDSNGIRVGVPASRIFWVEVKSK
ncbi:hypothetical protein ACSNOC_09860 [Streptomyces sp. URMC 129]